MFSSEAALRQTDNWVTRFAPSPTGLLHLGHLHAALFAQRQTQGPEGRFLLRIEDIDLSRCRSEFEEAIVEDLAWLGLQWEEPPRRQSDHLDDYAKALGALETRGLLYPCFCTRKDIQREIAASVGAPQGPDGPLYPGTCRRLTPSEISDRRQAGEAYALRLDSATAIAQVGPLCWHDLREGEQQAQPQLFGDVVLARKDIATSYHLSVVVDDGLQGVTLVTRGRDLFEASHLHRLLQALLNLPVPTWHHHDLVTDDSGKRLAKRNDALSLRALREAGHSPQEVRKMAGFSPDR